MAAETSMTELFERHLLYEVWMLFETRARFVAGVDDTVVRNALIESFCIHARGLIDFFNDKKGAAVSAFTNFAYVPFANGPVPEKLVTKLSTQIAHLTRKRSSDPREKIDQAAREELLLMVSDELRNFRNHLLPEYRSLWPKSLPAAPSEAPTSTTKSRATNAITTTST